MPIKQVYIIISFCSNPDIKFTYKLKKLISGHTLIVFSVSVILFYLLCFIVYTEWNEFGVARSICNGVNTLTVKKYTIILSVILLQESSFT